MPCLPCCELSSPGLQVKDCVTAGGCHGWLGHQIPHPPDTSVCPSVCPSASGPFPMPSGTTLRAPGHPLIDTLPLLNFCSFMTDPAPGDLISEGTKFIFHLILGLSGMHCKQAQRECCCEHTPLGMPLPCYTAVKKQSRSLPSPEARTPPPPIPLPAAPLSGPVASADKMAAHLPSLWLGAEGLLIGQRRCPSSERRR